MTPLRTVEVLLGHIGNGETTKAIECFDNTVDFNIPHANAIPWIPEVDSKEGIRKFFELLSVHLETQRFEIEKMIADDDDVVVIGSMTDKIIETGRTFDTSFAMRMTVENGLVTRYHMLEDSNAVANAYFGHRAAEKSEA